MVLHMLTPESSPVSLRGITAVAGSQANGAAMTGPEHFRRAEELAAEAHKLLGQATAGVRAVVAQIHTVLALAAATAAGASTLDSRACSDVAGTPL
jgi:hypothetical protein